MLENVRKTTFLALGCLALTLGLLGLILPLLPTTCFMLLAAWAFSKSSPRFYRWLVKHPYIGPPVRYWQQYRCITERAKRTATLSILCTFSISLWWFNHSTAIVIVLLTVMILLLVFINTRNELPEEEACKQSLSTWQNIADVTFQTASISIPRTRRFTSPAHTRRDDAGPVSRQLPCCAYQERPNGLPRSTSSLNGVRRSMCVIW